MPERYYVVQTQPQKERLAARELRNQNFDTFFPTLSRAPRVTRGKLVFPEPLPLFPKYLFIRLDLAEAPWRSISGTRGVTRLMCMDERPSAVPTAVMSRLLAAGELIPYDTAALPFDPGDGVEFTEGPMRGLRGVVTLCAADRVTLLLDLLGGPREVKCAPGALKFVSA